MKVNIDVTLTCAAAFYSGLSSVELKNETQHFEVHNQHYKFAGFHFTAVAS